MSFGGIGFQPMVKSVRILNPKGLQKVAGGAAKRKPSLVGASALEGSAQYAIDKHKQIVYTLHVIRTFADSDTERFYASGKSRRMPPEIRKRAAVRLNQLDAATQVEDLMIPPSNRLEQLRGDRDGQWSVRINDQWRICFRFKEGDAFDVEIADYH